MNKKILSFLPLFVFSASLFVAAIIIVQNPTSPDSWLHLGVGKFIVENKRIPQHSDISFKKTSPVLEWIDHSWFADVIIYKLSAPSFFLAAVTILIPLLLISLYLLYRILKLYDLSMNVILASLTTTTILSLTYWKIHPLVFLTPFLLLLIFSYLKWRLGRSRFVFLIPVLFFCVANLVGGFIFLLGIFLGLIFIFESSLYILNEVRERPFIKTQGNLRFFYISSALSLVASLINPNGGAVWLYGVTVYVVIVGFKQFFVSLPGVLTLANSNYIKSAPSSTLYLFYTLYLFLLLGGLFYVLLRVKKGFFSMSAPILSALIFLLFAGFWVRLIPIAVFCTAPIMAIVFHHLAKHSSINVRVGILVQYFLYIGLGLCLISLMTRYLFDSGKSSEPEPQTDLVQKVHAPDNILSSVDLIGYSFYRLYPRRSYLDATDDLFDEHELIIAYDLLDPIQNNLAESVLSSDQVNTVLASKNFDFLTTKLSRDKNWALLYFDYDGLVFVKKNKIPKKTLNTYALTHVDLARNIGFDPTNATASAQELEEFTKRQPESTLAIGQLASIYRFQKNFAKAENTLQRIPSSQWDFIVMTEMGRLQAAQGRCYDAERWFLSALEQRNERSLSRTVFDLAILYAGCLGDKEKAKHYFLRYNSYPIPAVERERAKKIADQFGVHLGESEEQDVLQNIKNTKNH